MIGLVNWFKYKKEKQKATKWFFIVSIVCLMAVAAFISFDGECNGILGCSYDIFKSFFLFF